jgi:hypothetical protein
MKLVKEGQKVDFSGTSGLSKWGAKKHEADKKRKAAIAKASRKKNR